MLIGLGLNIPVLILGLLGQRSIKNPYCKNGFCWISWELGLTELHCFIFHMMICLVGDMTIIDFKFIMLKVGQKSHL